MSHRGTFRAGNFSRIAAQVASLGASDINCGNLYIRAGAQWPEQLQYFHMDDCFGAICWCSQGSLFSRYSTMDELVLRFRDSHFESEMGRWIVLSRSVWPKALRPVEQRRPPEPVRASSASSFWTDVQQSFCSAASLPFKRTCGITDHILIPFINRRNWTDFWARWDAV